MDAKLTSIGDEGEKGVDLIIKRETLNKKRERSNQLESDVRTGLRFFLLASTKTWEDMERKKENFLYCV